MQWIPTFTLFLFLYPLGWLLSHFSYLFIKDISSNNLSIIGTILTFLLFILILPTWSRHRWKTNNVWLELGLEFTNQFRLIKLFINGFICSILLLFIFFIFIYLTGFVKEFNPINFNQISEAIVLIVGIVFAEELIFRGWLMREMILLFGPKKAIIFQCSIFSLAHYRSDIGFLAMIPFLSGLFLFGLVLTLRKALDKGSIYGCIGLHGGLVGLWYLVDSGLIVFSNDTPYYFLGPSKNMQNPIGSIVGIIILLVIIYFQRRLFSKTGRFLASTVRASFREETP